MAGQTRHLLLALSLGLAACSPDSSSAPPPEPVPADSDIAPAPPGVTPGNKGITLIAADGGVPRPLDFGTTKAETLSALRARGAPALTRNAECGAGPLEFADWPDGLQLVFQDGMFAGWAITLDNQDARKLTLANGLGIGADRRALDAALHPTVSQTSLGVEFTAGPINGLLDGEAPTSRVTHLWAGVDCAFR